MRRRADWRRVAAVLFLVSGVQYVIAEAVAASAWSTPAYSYATYYVSDLGVTGCGSEYGGRLVCSPLHAVMNGSFIAEGALFVVAMAILVAVAEGRSRWVLLAFAAVHGVGFALVALVSESAGTAAFGVVPVHTLGAAMAIVGGNLAVIGAGRALRMPRWSAVASVALGVIGIVSVILLELHTGLLPVGVFERGSIYTIIAWELAAGLILAIRPRPRRD